jgi:type IV secretion system protein VirD4
MGLFKKMDNGPYLGRFRPGWRPKGAIRYSGPKHLITIGPPGSGKSAGLVVPNVADLKRSMLIIDPKGELAAITARARARLGRVIILNPFGLFADELPHLASQGFNVMAQLDPASDGFADDGAALAEALVPVEGEQNKYFPISARNLVTALILWEKLKNGETANLLNVRRMLTAPSGLDGDGVPVSGFMKTLFDMALSDCDAIANRAGRLVERLTETSSSTTSVQDVIETAAAETAFLDSPPIARDLAGGNFHFADMRREIVTVYLILPTSRLNTHAKWLRLIITAALRALYEPVPFKQKVRLPPVLFILDEFAQLGRLEAIEAALGIARGSGVQLWPFLQDLSQLKDLYPRRWETFMTGAGVITAYAPRDWYTAEYLSKMCGQKTDITIHQNLGQSLSGDGNGNSEGWGEHGFPLLRPEKLRQMKPETMLCFVEPEPNPFFTEAPPYPRTPYCAGLDRNPYYRK